MGLIAQVEEPSPVFIHIDMDDLWAIGECYGYDVPAEQAHVVSETAMPRFLDLFNELDIKATFFIVGRDLESPAYVSAMQQVIAAGHSLANHSWSHSLQFRNLGPQAIETEITACHHKIRETLGVEAIGFRAPGYGWSTTLLDAIERLGYRYDSSLMPSPYGGIFRWLDKRMQQRPVEKSQYPVLKDAFHSLFPAVSATGATVEIPSATSPLLRLPFQAGVCMRLGYPYFSACLRPLLWNPALPFVLLFHAVDLADLRAVKLKLISDSSFFNTPLEKRIALARGFLTAIKKYRPIITTEQWLKN